MYLRVSLAARLPTSLAPCFDQRRFIPCAWFLGLALSQLLSRVDLQLLNVVLHRLTQIGNQVVAIRNLNGRVLFLRLFVVDILGLFVVSS
jgi:hypothetical protein